jgi:hypothetical protein
MLNTPLYLDGLFILTVILAIVLLLAAAQWNKTSIFLLVLISSVQSLLGLSGFYTGLHQDIPRFPLLLLPSLALVLFGFLSKRGRLLIDRFDIRQLTLLHIVRIPVEIVLYLLFLHKAVPGLMTFEGRNFDLLSGLTAPVLYYLVFIRRTLSPLWLLVWNIGALVLLLNVVINGVLSAPTPFQQFAFDQPNIAVLYFPYVLLPSVLVPLVLLAHLVSIRRLWHRSAATVQD